MATEIKTIKIEEWEDIRELVMMSIGTDKGSWFADPSFGSDLRKLRQAGKINSKTAGTVQRMILESLNWLKTDSLVSKIACQAEQAGKNQISYTVTVERPKGQQPIIIKDVWNAV